MTMNTPVEGNGNPEDTLSIAYDNYGRMLSQVHEVISTLEDENTAVSNEVARRIRDLSKVLQTLFEERAKVEKLSKQSAGIVHDYALDFDAARAEIGRRMACLRRVGETTGISERSE